MTSDGGLKESPRLSPDGELVAFAWNGPSRTDFDIYVKARQGDARIINVTEHPAGDNAPVWSPDGKELAFVRNDRGRVSIHIASWPGRQTRKIVDVAGVPGYANHRIATLSWSPPHGQFLVYAEKRSNDAPARIMRVDVNTLETRVLTSASEGTNPIGDFEPSYSPDGEWIAFVRAPASYSTLDIWIMDEEGQNARRVTAGQWAFVHSLSWLPSGEELLFTAGDLFSRRALLGETGRRNAAILWRDSATTTDSRTSKARDSCYARYATAPLRLWETPQAQRGRYRARSLVTSGSKDPS